MHHVHPRLRNRHAFLETARPGAFGRGICHHPRGPGDCPASSNQTASNQEIQSAIEQMEQLQQSTFLNRPGMPFLDIAEPVAVGRQ